MVRRNLAATGAVRASLRVLGLSTALVLCASGAAAQNLAEEVQSARERVDSAQSKLDRLLKELRQGLRQSEAEQLTRVQKQWHRFVNIDCSWERGFAVPGSVAPLVHANCMEQHLRARTDRLKVLLCEGRGLTGGCEAAERY